MIDPKSYENVARLLDDRVKILDYAAMVAENDDITMNLGDYALPMSKGQASTIIRAMLDENAALLAGHGGGSLMERLLISLALSLALLAVSSAIIGVLG